MLRTFVVACFTEEPQLLQAVRELRARRVRIHDVFTPYPVHGLDKAMGLRRSRIPWLCLAGGVLGLLTAIGLQFYTTILDWPMNVGGKPDNSTLAFIPISFELTILLAGIVTVGGLLLRARLFPGGRSRLILEGVTDDHFALVLVARHRREDIHLQVDLLAGAGASAIYERQETL